MFIRHRLFLAFDFITATAPFVLACRQKYSMEPMLCFAEDAFSHIDSTGCASTARATQMHQLSRVSVLLLFQVP